jgi:2'-5' RNA ligase
MRLFVACELPEEVKADVARHVLKFRAELQASWVKSESLHLTLAFIGEQPEGAVAKIAEALKISLAAARRVSAHLAGGGVFPNVKRARVGWVGAEPAGEIASLAARSREGLGRVAVSFDDKPFKSHVTLARFRMSPRREQAEAFVRHLSSYESTPFELKRVVLFSSEFSSHGAIHTEVAAVGLS